MTKWGARIFYLVIAAVAFVVGALLGPEATRAVPDSECYYEIYLVSIVDTLGEKKSVSGVKFVSERDGYLTLYDTLGGWFIIPIRDDVNYIKCSVTDSVKCEGPEK